GGVYADGDLVHLASLVELDVALDRLLPPAARAAGVRVAATVFDLIPMAMPESYLDDPGRRRRYLARMELLRAADGIIAISDFVAEDIHARLAVDRARIESIPLAPSSSFVPPSSPDDAARRAAAATPGLRVPFVLYTGGSDGRKNLEALVKAWSRLPIAVPAKWQLVIAGSLPPLHR